MVSRYAGLRAAGNSSALTTRPTCSSVRKNSSGVDWLTEPPVQQLLRVGETVRPDRRRAVQDHPDQGAGGALVGEQQAVPGGQGGAGIDADHARVLADQVVGGVPDVGVVP